MAITSLMIQFAIHDLGFAEGSDEYIQVSLNLTMLIGMISFIIGSCQLGVVANFLSESVLSGFISASSCVIILSQMKVCPLIEI
jgi:SulP family sulfate permease